MTLEYTEVFPRMCATGQQLDGWLSGGRVEDARAGYLRLLRHMVEDHMVIDQFVSAKATLSLLLAEMLLGHREYAERILSRTTSNLMLGGALGAGLKALTEAALSDEDQAMFRRVHDALAGTLLTSSQVVLSPWDLRLARSRDFMLLVSSDGKVWKAPRNAKAEPFWKRWLGGAKDSGGTVPTVPLDLAELPACPDPIRQARECGEMKHGGGMIERLLLSPKGQYLASWTEGSTQLWDVAGRENAGRLQGERTLIGFSQDEQELYATAAGQLETFRCPWLDLVRRRDGMEGRTLTADARVMAGFNADGLVALFDMASGKMQTLGGEQGYRSMHCLAFSPDGALLAEARGHQVSVWDTRTRQVVCKTPSAGRDVTCVQFLPAGDRFACGTMGGSCFVHDARSGGLINRYLVDAEIRCMDISADGRLVVVGCADLSSNAYVLHLVDKALYCSIEPGSDRDAWSAAFLPGATTVAIGHEDGIIRLWELTAIRDY